MQSKDRMLNKLGVRQLSDQDGRKNGAGVTQLEAISNAVRTTGPTSVHQPHGAAMLLDLLSKHGGIRHRLARPEWATEARAEIRSGLLDARLSTSKLRCIAIHKVVLRLFCGQLGHWRKNAEGVRREEDHILRMRAH